MAKINLKLLLIIAVTLVAMLIIGTRTVNAAEYSEKEKKAIFTVEDLPVGATVKGVYVSIYEPYSDSKIERICNDLQMVGAKQNLLNTYSSSVKQVPVKVKVQLPANTIKVEVDGVETTIQNISGAKYVEVSETLKYTNTSLYEPVKEDVRSITIGAKDIYEQNTQYVKIKVYSSETEYKEYEIYNTIGIESENVPYDYSYSIVNKYGKPYVPYGGEGGYEFVDKEYLQDKANSSALHNLPVELPKTVNLKETYLKVEIDVYQGETIEVENVGTLYYTGMSKEQYKEKYHVYKNSLDKIKELKKETNALIVAKTESGYTLKRPISIRTELSENVKEEDITGKFTADSQNTKLNIKYYVSGVGDAKINSVQISKNEYMYKKLEKEMYDRIINNKQDFVIMDVFDIHVVEGSYKGKLEITFDVGNENNGKTYIVGHFIAGLRYEYYQGTVKDGKITIETDSLSPFMIAIEGKKQEANEGNQVDTEDEKDETPPTGTIDVVGYAVIIATLAGAGIAIIDKK